MSFSPLASASNPNRPPETKADKATMNHDQRQPSRSLRFWAAAVTGLTFLVVAWAGPQLGPGTKAPAILKLSVVDESTKQPIPARVEVLDKDGKGYVAEDALLIGGGPGRPARSDCGRQEILPGTHALTRGTEG